MVNCPSGPLAVWIQWLINGLMLVGFILSGQYCFDGSFNLIT